MDETGILLGLVRTHARAQPGTRVSSLKPFYRGAKVTVIGAISINKVLAAITLDISNNSQFLSPVGFWLLAVLGQAARNQRSDKG